MNANGIKISSFIKIAYRIWRRTPFYTLANLIGLAVGIASCLLIGLFIFDELSYDRFHNNPDQVYRITQEITGEGKDEKRAATTPLPLNEALINEFSDYISSGVRLFDLDSETVAIKDPVTDETIRQDKFFFTDPELFEVFEFALVRGDPAQVLLEPNSVVITESIARTYFGDEDPVGREFHFEGRISLHVTGVMQDWPENSHFKADFLASFESLRGIWRNYDQITSRWRWNPVWTYVRLKEGVDAPSLTENINRFTEPRYSEVFTGRESVDLELQPLTDIWLYSNLVNEIGPVSSYITIYMFVAVAFFILILAGINFINLSAVAAMRRSKEIGIRKVLGAERSGLVSQFMLESMTFISVAIVLGLGFAWLAYPYFEIFTGREIQTGHLGLAEISLILVTFITVLSLLAGLYPSAVLSSLNPIESLRGTLSKGTQGTRIRKGLVVIQFGITAMLLIATAIVYFQFNHLLQRDLGFDREQVIAVPMSMTSAIWSFDALKQRAVDHSSIQSVTGVKSILGSSDFWKYDMTPGDMSEEDTPSFCKLFVLHDFLETMNIELLAGRDFSEDYSTDAREALLINRAMVDFLEWGDPQDAIGRPFRNPSGEYFTVIGVTENFNHTYLRRELEPLIMELPANKNQMVTNIDYMKVKLASGEPGDAITHLQKIWEEVDQTHPFDYIFVDERLNQYYDSERRMILVLGIFALIAISVGSLGLLGLSSYSVKVREKEMAIRKTLGLSASGVFYLLSKDYLKLVLLAHLLALPVIYLVATRWITDFPYHINLISYLAVTFVISLVLSMIVSLSAISTQSVKAALVNPADCLKNE